MVSFCFAGQNDNSLLFDGDGDYVEFPHIPAYNVAAVTIEMWVYWNGAEIDFLVGKAYEELEIHTTPDNSLRFIPTDLVYLDTPAGKFYSEYMAPCCNDLQSCNFIRSVLY